MIISLGTTSHVKISSLTPPTGVNYYDLLEISQDATLEEINRSWRSLVLRLHPDKQALRDVSTATEKRERDIRLINEAKWVLGDAQRRQEWETAFYQGEIPRPSGPHIYHEISLEEFIPHYPSQIAQDDITAEDEVQEIAEWYSHPCRCSGEFVITHQDLENGVDVVGCQGCGEWVRVGYEVVEDDEGDDQGGADDQESVIGSSGS